RSASSVRAAAIPSRSSRRSWCDAVRRKMRLARGSRASRTSCAAIPRSGSTSSTCGSLGWDDQSPCAISQTVTPAQMDETSEFGRMGAREREAALTDILSPDLRPLFNVSFIRSQLLYDEFVYRLVLQIVREIGVHEAAAEPASVVDLAERVG